MEIQETKVRKIRLTMLNQLDPIDIFLEDYRRGVGQITIVCFGKSWTSYWGGMGDRTIAEFFISCNNYYLLRNLNESEDDRQESYLCRIIDAVRDGLKEIEGGE